MFLRVNSAQLKLSTHILPKFEIVQECSMDVGGQQVKDFKLTNGLIYTGHTFI